MSYPLFSAVPLTAVRGAVFRRSCLQRFLVMGAVFAFWRERPRLARSFRRARRGVRVWRWASGQVMRGAHFFLTTCGPGGGSGFPVWLSTDLFPPGLQKSDNRYVRESELSAVLSDQRHASLRQSG